MINTTPRLLAEVTLQRKDARGKSFETVDVLTLDVTSILALPAEKLRSVVSNFDGDEAPYIGNLPASAARALRAAHGGPTEVSIDICDFFNDLSILPEDEYADARNLNWLTDEILEKARAVTNASEPEAVEGESMTFSIGDEHTLVTYSGGEWEVAGTFPSMDSLEAARNGLTAPGLR